MDVMKTLSYISFIMLILNSCNHFDEKYFNKDVFTQNYIKFNAENDLVSINIDSLENFSELRKEMVKIACDGKVSGLKFNMNETNYHTIGFAECKTNAIGCYFNKITFIIKNDSILLDFSNKIPLKNLKNEIDSIISEPYNYQYNKDILEPALIHLYIDDNYNISKTKEVLKEINEQFENINSAYKSGFFEYNILFEDEWYFTKPPPPPPPNVE